MTAPESPNPYESPTADDEVGVSPATIIWSRKWVRQRRLIDTVLGSLYWLAMMFPAGPPAWLRPTNDFDFSVFLATTTPFWYDCMDHA